MKLHFLKKKTRLMKMFKHIKMCTKKFRISVRNLPQNLIWYTYIGYLRDFGNKYCLKIIPKKLKNFEQNLEFHENSRI